MPGTWVCNTTWICTSKWTLTLQSRNRTTSPPKCGSPSARNSTGWLMCWCTSNPRQITLNRWGRDPARNDLKGNSDECIRLPVALLIIRRALAIVKKRYGRRRQVAQLAEAFFSRCGPHVGGGAIRYHDHSLDHPREAGDPAEPGRHAYRRGAARCGRTGPPVERRGQALQRQDSR